MSMNDKQDTGIPTKAIHEAYLTMQQAHREYRRARDNDLETHGPKGTFQDAVLTFYELVRPHLKHESSLSDFWTGNLPDYTGWNFNTASEAATYVRENGTGVYQVQQHTDTVQIKQDVLTDGGLEGFEQWHDFLNLSWDTERLVAVQPDDNGVHFVKVLRAAVLPLRELDHWQTHVVKERTQGDGFMEGQTTTDTRLEYQSAQKLITAKRLLVEAADKLGALSEFDASSPRTEITREDINKVEEWRQEQLD